MVVSGKDSKHSSTTFRAHTGIGFSSLRSSGIMGSSSCATTCANASVRPSSQPPAAAVPVFVPGTCDIQPSSSFGTAKRFLARDVFCGIGSQQLRHHGKQLLCHQPWKRICQAIPPPSCSNSTGAIEADRMITVLDCLLSKESFLKLHRLSYAAKLQKGRQAGFLWVPAMRRM